MWTKHWPLSALRDVDRAARKIIVENGGKHLASLTSLLYLPREKEGRGLRSVEQEYKTTKIKSLLKLYQNSDQTVKAVRELIEDHALASGHQSLIMKLYTKEKTQTSTDGEVLCRLCGKVTEGVAHVLARCSSLTQT